MTPPNPSNKESPSTNAMQARSNVPQLPKPDKPETQPTVNGVGTVEQFTKREKLAIWCSIPHVAIGVVMLLSFVVRWIDIERGLWLDELHTSWVVADGFNDVGQRAVAGNQAPLYFFICKACVWTLGHHEWTLRLTSLLAGICLPLIVWQVLRRLTRSQLIPLSAALLIAIDPYFIRYSQEARPYALLQLFGLLQFVAFVWRFKSMCLRYESADSERDVGLGDGGPRDLKGIFNLATKSNYSFVIWSIVCFYIHYTSVLLTASCFLFLLAWILFSGTKVTRRVLSSFLDFAWIGLGIFPMLVLLLGIAKRKSNWELFVNDDQVDPSICFQLITYVLIGVLIWLIVSVTRRFFQPESNSISTIPRSTLVSPRVFYGSAFLFGYFGPILLSWFALKTDLAPLYLSRYFLIGWTNAILFLGISLIQLRNSFSSLWSGALVSLCLIMVFASSFWQNDLMWSMIQEKKLAMPFESAWRDAIGFMNESVVSDDARKKQDDENQKANGGSFGSSDASSIVYLFPNLIEDQMLPERKSSQVTATELEDYCCFPFRGLYRLRIEEQVPKPTLLSHRFNHIDAREMREKGNVWIVIRGNSMIVADILTEFSALQSKENILIVPIEKREFSIRGAPGNFIFVANFHVAKQQKIVD